MTTLMPPPSQNGNSPVGPPVIDLTHPKPQPLVSPPAGAEPESSGSTGEARPDLRARLASASARVWARVVATFGVWPAAAALVSLSVVFGAVRVVAHLRHAAGRSLPVSTTELMFLQLVFVLATAFMVLRFLRPFAAELRTAEAKVKAAGLAKSALVETLEGSSARVDTIRRQIDIATSNAAHLVAAIPSHVAALCDAFMDSYKRNSEPTDEPLLGEHAMPVLADLEDPQGFVLAFFDDDVFELPELEHQDIIDEFTLIERQYSVLPPEPPRSGDALLEASTPGEREPEVPTVGAAAAKPTTPIKKAAAKVGEGATKWAAASRRSKR